MTESAVEAFCLEVLESQGYRFVSPELLNCNKPDTALIEGILRKMLPHSPCLAYAGRA